MCGSVSQWTEKYALHACTTAETDNVHGEVDYACAPMLLHLCTYACLHAQCMQILPELTPGDHHEMLAREM